MKLFSENKSNPAAAIITIAAAVTVAGLMSAALRSGRINSFLQRGKPNSKGKLFALGNQKEISDENALLRENLKRLSTTMDKMAIQNEKLVTKNTALERALEEERDRVAKLMDVITVENEEKLVLTRKLEEAISKLSTTGYITGTQETLNEAKTKVS